MTTPWWRHLLPGRCLLCQAALPPEADPDVCGYCLDALPWNEPACPRCGLPLPQAGARCRDCARRRPPCSITVAPLRYEAEAALWVRRLKDRAGMVEGRTLGVLLAQAVQRRYQQSPALRRPDLLAPVPLGWWRLARRGHNQAITLAVPVARALGVPLARSLLTRHGGVRQRGSSRARRLNQPANVFRCRRRWEPPGPCVALVDDVITTGATAAAAARTLIDAGAAEVHVLAATRTPPPDAPG